MVATEDPRYIRRTRMEKLFIHSIHLHLVFKGFYELGGEGSYQIYL